MQKLTFCLGLLLLSLNNNAFSQIYTKAELSVYERPSETERCGTNQYMLQRFAENPELYERYQEVQQQLYPDNSNLKSLMTCDASNSVRVPLAFHFDNSFDCSDQACILTKIQDAIATLNEDFASNVNSPNAANCPLAYPDISTGTCIEFYLAVPPACSGLDVSCDGAITVGQFEGGYSGGGNGAGACWDDYLNVFVQSPQTGNLGVADQIPDALPPDGPGEGVTIGAPYFGGAGGPCGSIDTDGTHNLGKIFAHEIGHYLGLFHSFQGGCNDEPNNTFKGANITVNDTPAQQYQYSGCPTGCVNSGCGDVQQTANIMNYTDDACMDMFSADQAAAMNIVANGLFGDLDIPEANPAELYTQCTGNTCVVICPTVVQTAYVGAEDVCAGIGNYTLPTTYDVGTATTITSLVLDASQSATYAWSTGSYISAGGAALTNTKLTLTNPEGCDPVPQTIYLNVACADGSIADINAGEFTLNVYPDPTQFTAADLVTISGEGTCDEPTLIPNCANVTITPDAANPTFPLNPEQVSTANYIATYAASVGMPNCCLIGIAGELMTNGDFGEDATGWSEIEEVPSGTPNPNPLGIIGVSNGGSDAWFGGWGSVTGANSVLSSTISISQTIDIPTDCSTADLSFDYGIVCGGNASIIFTVSIGGITVGTLDCSNAGTGTFTAEVIGLGVPQGIATIVLEGIENDPDPKNSNDAASVFIDNISLVSGNCTTTVCDIPIAVNYNCTEECTDCNNPTCTTIQVCDDNDPCTENDEETIMLSDGLVCIPCSGTAVTACMQTTTQSCDDNNSCTINDMEVIDVCTGDICVPCSGVFDQPSCCGNVNLEINFDDNPEQTSWDIKDAGGNVVASGDAYSTQDDGSNLNMSPIACLADGCYDLNFYDSGNDGMCPRRISTITSIGSASTGIGGVFSGIPRVGSTCGDYTLTDSNGIVLASGGGRFGSIETTSFCLFNGTALLNYQPDYAYARQSTFNNSTVDMWITPTLVKDEMAIYNTLDEADNAQINIVDMNGRIMQQHSQDGNSTRELQLNVSDFPAGIYFVQMKFNDVILVEKFVKK